MFRPNYFFGGKSKEEYTAPESKPPAPEHFAHMDKEARIFAYRALGRLERDRERGAPDDEEILISWLEDEYTEEGHTEYTGITTRAKLAEVLKTGLSTSFEERGKLSIPVAESGARHIWHPFYYHFEYTDPTFYGGSAEDLRENPKNIKISRDDSPYIERFKMIKKEGRVLKSEIAMYVSKANALLFENVSRLLDGSYISESDKKYYEMLRTPWKPQAKVETKTDVDQV